MKRSFMIALLMLVSVVMAQAQEIEKGSLWLGSHYTGFGDYSKKVAEYNLGNEDWFPEFRLNYFSQRENTIFNLDGHYFDDQNITGKLDSRIGQSFSGSFQYRSLSNQSGQDLLSNMNTREWLSTRPGGKILTSELHDPGADYATHRQELKSDVDFRLFKKNNIRLLAAHQMILEKGTEQRLETDHCFSCHVESSAGKVDRRTHQLKAGLEGTFGKQTLGYTVSYRQFDSRAPEQWADYDVAKHPANGSNEKEFSSRLNFSDTSLPFGIEPNTRKVGHKVKLNGALGRGRVAGSLGYTTATNQNTDLSTDAWSGAVSYNVPLSKKSRLIARASGSRVKADDPYIDLPDYRRGATNGPIIDFDFVRYSSLDRLDARASLELISRLTPKTTVTLQTGWNRIDRDDYVDFAGNTATNKLYGKAKLRWRKNSKLSLAASYRIEMISDPFASSRGLLEAPGRDILQPLDSTVPISPLVYYFQREDLRYQLVTSMPTSAHYFDLSATLVPSAKASLLFNVKGSMDKNGDLDSLDVEHFYVQPNLTMTLMPSPQWALNAGYTFSHNTARLPVAIALFDG